MTDAVGTQNFVESSKDVTKGGLYFFLTDF